MVFKNIHVFRVKPGQELLAAITRYCRKSQVNSAIVLGIIGSLYNAHLKYVVRLPAMFKSSVYPGPLEIVAAQGTVARKGDDLIIHIHLQVASQQVCTGGHLTKAKVFSTAEVSLGELDYQLHRQTDAYTGLNELVC